LEGKCYRQYGYIEKIYDIMYSKDGIIIKENPTASATYHVKFGCKLCIPLKNQTIICKVNKINKLLITLVNGPIRVIITADRLNKNIFSIDAVGNYRYKNNSNKFEIL